MTASPIDCDNLAAAAALETPCVVIDYRRLWRNLEHVQAIADAAGVALRPHIKTHKSLDLARLQIGLGAAGITAAKPDEALVFLAAGFPSVTVAYPLLAPAKAERLIEAARDRGTDLRCIADSIPGVEALSAAAARHGTVALPVFMKVDVGLHRCGVTEGSPAALAVARRIAEDPRLRFAGLLSHAGNAYAGPDAAAVRAAARREREILGRVAARLCAEGIAVPEVSVGSTPTVLANDGFAGITEIRPGNYVFMDLTQVGLGVAAPDDLALSVLATVVSKNDDYLIVDAGSKVLSSDRGPHGTDAVKGFGLATPIEAADAGAPMTVARLSEEHGFLARGGARHDLPLGSRVLIHPNHACTAVNLADRLTVLGLAAKPVTWTVDGRGRVR